METLFDMETEEAEALAFVPLTPDSRQRMFRRLTASAKAVLGEPGPALDVLRALAVLGLNTDRAIPIANRKIGDLVGLSPPTICYHLESLAAAGLIAREFSFGARRGVRTIRSLYPYPARFLQDY